MTKAHTNTGAAFAVASAVALCHTSNASTLEYVEVDTRQPLAADIEEQFRSTCGNMVSVGTDGVSASRVEALFDDCNVTIDTGSGNVGMRTLVTPVSTTLPAGVGADGVDLLERRTQDLDLLDGIGFDEGELLDPYTSYFAASGKAGSTRVLGTKTWASRQVDGIEVMGNTVVVTRDSTGALVSVSAHWPALSAELLVESSDEFNTLSSAAAYTEFPISDVRTYMILGEINEDGVAEAAVVVDEVTHLLVGPSGASKPSGFLLFDGSKVFEFERFTEYLLPVADEVYDVDEK